MNRDGFVPVAIFLIVLGVFVVGGGVWYFSLKNIQPQLTTPESQTVVTTQSEVANWQIYHNTQYGFEMKYPPSLVVTETHDQSSNPNIVYVTDPTQGLFDGDQPHDYLLVKINPDSRCVPTTWEQGHGYLSLTTTVYRKTACVESASNYFIIMTALSESSKNVLDQVFSTFNPLSIGSANP